MDQTIVNEQNFSTQNMNNQTKKQLMNKELSQILLRKFRPYFFLLVFKVGTIIMITEKIKGER